jgi:hypothetical protein
MTPEQFTYWLQGKMEGRDILTFGDSELRMIEEHLKTVFHKVTPYSLITIPDQNMSQYQPKCTCGTASSQGCPVHFIGDRPMAIIC